MVNFLNLPTVQAPRNALADLSPIGNAIDGNRRNALMVQENARQQEELGMRKSEFEYRQTRDKKQDARSEVEYFGKQAAAIDRLQGPERAKAYQNLIARHPGRASLTPEYLDPVNGPKLIMAEAGQFRDPREDEATNLDLQYKRAQIGKINREMEGGAAKYGKTGAIVQGPDGRYYSVQFAEDGSKKIDPLAVGETALTPSRGVAEVDTGTGTQIIDKATGLPVRDVAKDLAGAEREKAIGDAQGKATADLPRVSDNAALALKTINDIRNHPGKAYGTGVAGVLPGIPGTQQRGFVNLVDQAKGKTFLEAFNSLRGGGQITENEGAKATQALARLDRAQTPQDFEASLKDLEEVINLGLSRAKKATGRKMDLGDGFSVEIE